MKALLVGDTHFTDLPLDEYRWNLFEELVKYCLQYEVTHVIFLGDLTDRKDRHAGAFVNRLLDSIAYLRIETGCHVYILMGNHDGPLGLAPVYWKFLEYLDVSYITEPTFKHGIWMMPFSKNPHEAWQGLKLHEGKAILMHQTMKGARVEGDYELEGDNLPILPRGIPVYSGDVHRPQYAGRVTYIGAPYPVKFSESWENQILCIESTDWRTPTVIQLRIMRRAILDLTSVPAWPKQQAGKYQVRVRYHLSSDEMRSWPSIELALRASAEDAGITIASIEAVLSRDLPLGQNVTSIDINSPERIIRAYADMEKLDPAIIEYGLRLYAEAQR